MKRLGKKIWLMIGALALALAMIAALLVYLIGVLPEKRAYAELLRQKQAYTEAKIAQYVLENEKYDDYEVEVAFIGDSLTDGCDVKNLYPEYLTVNRGIGGDTTFDLEKRLQVSLYDLKPQVVVMLIGANNMDTMLENYESILVGLSENLPESKVVLLSLTAMGGEHWGRKNQLAAYQNVKIELLAQKYGYTFVDLFTPLYDVSIGEVYEGYTTDGGHFTPLGYEKVREQVLPVLQELLEK